MRSLLNTLFVTSEDLYLALEGENVVVLRGRPPPRVFRCTRWKASSAFPTRAPPCADGACAQRASAFPSIHPRGKFYCQTSGAQQGNVLLRREQFRRADSPPACRALACSFLTGKLYNARWVLQRTVRDQAMRVDAPRLKHAAQALAEAVKALPQQPDAGALRGPRVQPRRCISMCSMS